MKIMVIFISNYSLRSVFEPCCLRLIVVHKTSRAAMPGPPSSLATAKHSSPRVLTFPLPSPPLQTPSSTVQPLATTQMTGKTDHYTLYLTDAFYYSISAKVWRPLSHIKTDVSFKLLLNCDDNDESVSPSSCFTLSMGRSLFKWVQKRRRPSTNKEATSKT